MSAPRGTATQRWDLTAVAAEVQLRSDRPAAPEPLVGRIVAGKYQLEAVIGSGACGVVYRARQVTLDRVVAVKILHRDLARSESLVKRFQREALAASRLDHPSSVRVVDFGEERDGLLFLVMEYVEGKDLLTLIEEAWPFAPERTAWLIGQVLGALAIAHEQDIIHRDVKPENILVVNTITDDGDPIEMVKVCDFGVASLGLLDEGESRMTREGLVLGTPEYMSPEQARGEPIDARSDLYSVGAVLYHLLTGQPPFSDSNPVALALKHVTEPVVPPSCLHSEVDPKLEELCLRALAKAPAARYPSARAMRAELLVVMEARGSTLLPLPERRVEQPSTPRMPVAAPPTAPDTLATFARVTSTQIAEARAPRHRYPLGLAAAVLVAVVVFGVARRKPEAPALTAVETTEVGASATVLAEPPLDTPAAASVHAPATTPIGKPKKKSVVAGRPARPEPPRPAAPSAPKTEAKAAMVEAQQEAPQPAAPIVVASVAAAKPGLNVLAAQATVGAVSTTNALPTSSVRAAVAHVPFTRCYRDALTLRGAPASGTATLNLSMDGAGRVVTASLDGASFLPQMRVCVENAARSISVKNADTGEATARVVVTFAHP